NPDTQPRLYHNTALLLPDASILVMGGNNSRAGRFVDSGKVELDIFDDFFVTPKGFTSNTAEIYQHSIYYPPYLFGSSERPVIDTNITEINYGETTTISVSNASGSTSEDSMVLIKAGSVTHSFDNGQRLVNLEKTNNGNGQISFTVPTDKHFSPPGHYMLFYVNAEGKPSEGKIVKLS
ncbi:MAG: galactose oxidase early set domain-containing protein, partial [Crocosphaera sp.]